MPSSNRQGPFSATCEIVPLADGSAAVRKDYAQFPDPLRRALGRVALGREIRAYERLSGLRGIPRLLGLEPGALLIERVDGEALSDRHGLADAPGFLRQLEQLLAGVHARGVSHGEFRLAHVLVDTKQQPWLIDFATATVVEPPQTSMLFRLQCRLDRYGLLLIKEHLTPGALTPAEETEARATRRLAAVFRRNVL